MKPEVTKNPFGGSAGGGGYDYQAEAFALVASKILAEEGINWVETGCDRVPISVQMETGTGGDDLRIELRSGVTIELQAKRGLRRGDDLWCALIALAQVTKSEGRTYGVLLTNTEASGTVRGKLRDGIVKVGQGVMDDLPDIVKDLLRRLEHAGITDCSFCARIRIVIRDLDPGSSGEEETFAALRKVLAEPNQIGAARNTLVSRGLDLTRLRGRQDSDALIKLIKGAGLSLSPSSTNQRILRQAFIDWSIRANETIPVPALSIEVPVSQSWVKLRAMDPSERTYEPKSLAEQIQNYHEWHRLADRRSMPEAVDIESAAGRDRLLVVVGGPGSGKSTLLRRLTHSWSSEGRMVLRVSLRAMDLRMSRGETFDEALNAVASDGFPSTAGTLYDLLGDAVYLLADGLDETDLNRAGLADRLRRWATLHDTRHVVVTTRPIGYNPAWFGGWKHFELLPLESSDVEHFTEAIYNALSPDDSKHVKSRTRQFRKKLEDSRTASIAARNPQLLSFLISMFINGCDIGGNRFHLFDTVIEQMREQSVPDRRFKTTCERSVADRALQHLAWFLLHETTAAERELIRQVGQGLAVDLTTTAVQGEKEAEQALRFWEERGLLERLSSGSETTFTFVHMVFQEFAATRYLVRLPGRQLVDWLKLKYLVPRFRETILLTGGTDRVDRVVDTLLALHDPDDPVTTADLFAADVLAEAEDPPAELRERVVEHLTQRLTSSIPMTAYEAGERLRPLATLSPSMVGPVALTLAWHEQRWTQEVACVLGLLAGSEYVDVDALLAVFPAASDSGVRRGSGSRWVDFSLFEHRPIIEELINKGAEYLLQSDPSGSHWSVVKEKFKERNHSFRVAESLYIMLVNHLPPEELKEIDHPWSVYDAEPFRRGLRMAREADQVLLRAIVTASESLASGVAADVSADPQLHSLVQLWKVLEAGESPDTDFYALRRRPLQEPFIEVLRGAILVSSCAPTQLAADAEKAQSDMTDSGGSLYTVLGLPDEAASHFEPDWSLAQGTELEEQQLIRALSHPTWFVCSFAALLLMNCVERDVVCVGLKRHLQDGGNYALNIIAQVASEVWQDEAADTLLDRLQEDVTEDCAPLVKKLGDVCGEASMERAEATLRQVLHVRNAHLVEAALSAVESLELGDTMASDITEAYRWWLAKGPQRSNDSGVIPKNPASALLSHLTTRERLTFDEARHAACVGRSDVRGVAVEEICRVLAEETALIGPTFEDVANEQLPSSIVTRLSRSYPNVCAQHIEPFLRLVDCTVISVQIAAIRALGGGWAVQVSAETELRKLLHSHDEEIREEALRALRRLMEARAVLDESSRSAEEP